MIDQLKSQIQTISKSLAATTGKLDKLLSQVHPALQGTHNPCPNESSEIPSPPTATVHNSPNPSKSNLNEASPSLKPFDDRKFNVVVYGIQERKEGEAHNQRLVLDLCNVSNMFASQSTSVPKSAICDCFRLGKYSPESPCPRPILVRLNSRNVVMDILQKRSSFSPYVVKPDVPYNVSLQ